MKFYSRPAPWLHNENTNTPTSTGCLNLRDESWMCETRGWDSPRGALT